MRHARIAFAAMLALATLAAPLAAGAQAAGKVYRVGYLSAAQPRSTSFVVAFVDELAKLGYDHVIQ